MNIHDRVNRIIASYEGEMSTASIAAEHEIKKEGVRAVLGLAGVTLRRGLVMVPVDQTKQKAVANAYEDGLTLLVVMDKLKVSNGQLRHCLDMAGVEVRSPGEPRNFWAHLRERNTQMIALYRTGLTLQQIGASQNPKISRERVRQIIMRDAPDAHQERVAARAAKYAQWREEYEAGNITTKISASHGVSQTSIYMKLRDMGVTFRDNRGPKPKTIERTKAAFQMRAQGKKWSEIADELGFKSMTQAWSTCHRHPELVP